MALHLWALAVPPPTSEDDLAQGGAIGDFDEAVRLTMPERREDFWCALAALWVGHRGVPLGPC